MAEEPTTAAPEAIASQSRTALRELIDTLEEVDRRYASAEWMIGSPEDVAGAHRSMMHMLQGGLFSAFERDPSSPEFRKIVSPFRKFTGDNPDALYFEAPVSAEYSYVVRGNMAGGVYLSVTVEVGGSDGGTPERTAGVIGDADLDIDAEGNFEVFVGGEPQERNWLELDPNASSLTIRHYSENEEYAASDENLPVNLSIETTQPQPAPAPPNDASIAEGIRRVAKFLSARTIEMGAPGTKERPGFAGTTINEFPPPQPPGDHFLSFADAAYSLAPYYIADDEALVITGEWPECRAGYLCLWTRWQQTLDFRNRRVGLNRKQTTLEPDGTFKMVLAHQDPGHPNWIDTEGRNLGIAFWRFVLPEGDIVTPQAAVVPFSELR